MRGKSLLKALAKPGSMALPVLPMFYWWWVAAYRRGGASASGHSELRPAQPVERISGAGFHLLHRRREPAVITDIVTSWPALTKWTPEYFKQVAGERPVRVLTSASSDRNFMHAFDRKSYEHMTLGELIDIVFMHPPTEKRHYLFGEPGWGGWAPFTDDVFIPHLNDHPFSHRGTGIWIGQAENITGLHYDFWHGFLAQLRGRKRVVLFPPTESPKLAPTSPFGDSPCESRLPSHCLNADPAQFASFRDAVRYEVVLEPGDLLYIPLFWWHEVTSLDAGISIPMRYDALWNELVHPGTFPAAYDAVVRPILDAWRS